MLGYPAGASASALTWLAAGKDGRKVFVYQTARQPIQRLQNTGQGQQSGKGGFRMSSEVRFGNVSSIDYEAGKCEVTYPDRDDTVIAYKDTGSN